ncbi:MAG: permease-like cell division protein FtsX [Candidatus Methylopumilus sp.]|jgi:cell division transport system permease protein|nr:permease-like cell division protein FtsX [Candidatus Methylopumilus sp.]
MKKWLNQNIQSFNMVLVRMRQNLLGTVLICGVMGVTLSLPAILFTIIDNLGQVTGSIESKPQLSLFLKLDASTSTKQAISEQLKKHPDIAKYEFVSKESAWEQLQQNANTADISASLNKNPLPDAYFVTPKDIKPENVQRLQQEMQQWDGIELAQLDAKWIKRLDTLLKLGQKAIFVLVALLGFALVAIIGNTVRLQMMTQLDEIEVSKLIGATNQFIRRPFLYAGTLYGLGGGLAAWLIVLGVVAFFNTSVTEIADSYASQFRLSMPNATITLVMLLSAVGLGWLGSFVAVTRSLARIEKL